MQLSGDVGGIQIEIRESPALPSPGETSITDNGDGTFQIDSFFDVFTELSVNGGGFQAQTNEAGRMDLMRVRPTAILSQPDLPPEPNPSRCDQVASLYASSDALHALFPGGIDFDNPIHKCFENVTTSTDPVTGDETEQFDTTIEGSFDDGSGPQPLVLTGPVEIRTLRKGSDTTGQFDTEMVSMSLTGDVGGIPIEIRESPVRSSEGETRVDDIGGGQFEIDSFFDVFTEVSIAGGPFQPQTNAAVRMDLHDAPEPSGWLLLVSGLPWLHYLGMRRRRKM